MNLIVRPRVKEFKKIFFGARTVSPMSDSSGFKIMCRKIKNGTDRPYFNNPEIIPIVSTMLLKYRLTRIFFLYQYFVFMSGTARRDTSHIETLVSPSANLLVSSIQDRMGKLTRQGGMGKLPSI